jgi:hypothetical protein
MAEKQQVPRKERKKLWWALGVVLFLVALLVVPPLIGINHYKARITALMSASLGRTVRLTDVEMRLLPRPAFVISDLTVQEDPEFGAEPILHANSVTADIRLLSLWRGRLRIAKIDVDEASLNLVHLPDGRWNLDSLVRTANPGAARDTRGELPFLEATSSRINIKNGAEKLPFSLLDADASIWRESSGDWRVRLRGQPARTDVSLDLADTGIVRLEATLHPAAQLHQSAIRADLDWRQAQLGQLSRLLLASDEGWRGNLTGELHVEGTAAEAQINLRLRAEGVHREEFVPASPVDFDATCTLIYHYSIRTLEKVDCSSPVGSGRARITGDMPGKGEQPRMAVELDRVPAQVALDVLRTVRRRIDPTIQAEGTITGKISYDEIAVAAAAAAGHGKTPRRAQETHPPIGPLTGALTVDGLRISGAALSRPIQVAKLLLEPAPPVAGQPQALAGSFALPAGAAAPLAIAGKLTTRGFQVTIRGNAAIPRLREFARVAGSAAEPALEQLAGESAALDLAVEGPWMPPAEVLLASAGPVLAAAPPTVQASGTLTLRDANWKPGFLANAVRISSATLHLENGALRWDPIAYSYGPVKGAATLDLPDQCDTPESCSPRFTAHFASLDVEAVQSALLGAKEPGTLASELLARLRPSSQPAWPRLEGSVEADTLTAGPFTLTNAKADVRIAPTGAEISGLSADLMGGAVRGGMTLEIGDKPAYKVDLEFSGLKPAPVGQLMAMKWAGGNLAGNAHIESSGYSDKDISASAKGTLHFDWSHGSIANPPVIAFGAVMDAHTTAEKRASGAEWRVPPVLAHFDRFTGDAIIANGALALGRNQVQRAGHKSSIQATITFALPAKVAFASPFGPPKAASAAPIK